MSNSCDSWIVFLCDSNAIHEIHELHELHELLSTHHFLALHFSRFTFHCLKKLALIPTESVWQT